MSKARILCQLVRYFGLRWLLFRLVYSFKLHTGYLRRIFPAYTWSERPLTYWLRADVPSTPKAYIAWRRENSGSFFFDGIYPEYHSEESQQIIAEANAILDGCWPYFASGNYDIGMPPNWHLNSMTGQSIPADRHWTQISDFESGDIKYIWEASRFSVVYTLVRAYAASREGKYAAAFWELVNDWAKHNPPQLGPNWRCGQEASFRVMAWCFGLYAFMGHADPEQIKQIVAMIAAHGERIEGNIDYARSQNNNHGVSEGVGLWTIGILFPELRQARRWAEAGKRVVEEEIRKQVYSDGTYAQYSPNYQRVMLHDAVWALRLGELNDSRFPQDIYDKVASSKDFLLHILDLESGFVPNHGANDSALVLPLNTTNPNDFRPTIQMAHYLVSRERLFTGFDEDILWLFGPEVLDSHICSNAIQPKNLSAEVGGYYTLHGSDSWLMVRCAEYRARPHHADQLHVDFWWRGINICCDAGTYLYNGDPPWQNGLVTTAVHNTVTVDYQDQMTPYSRFLWLDWSQGRVLHYEDTYWEGSHNGYMRLEPPVVHRRGIQRLDDVWIIADELVGEGLHSYCLHWLLPNMPYAVIHNMITLQTHKGQFFIYLSESGIDLKTADRNSVQGWRSSTYGQKEPALSSSVTSSGERIVIFWTMFSPRSVTIIDRGDTNLLVDGIQLKLGRDRLIEIERS